MSKNTAMSRLAIHAFRCVASRARVLAHFCVLFVVALFPCGTPSFGLQTVIESEAPVDQYESSVELAISVQSRTRVVRNQPGLRLPVPKRDGFRLVTARIASASRSGHCLPNDFLAPLRC